MSQKQKTKFRNSAKWKKFRIFQKKLWGGKDYITNRPLYKGFTVHHMDLNSENYEDITRPEKFIPLNKQTHEFIHWIFRYYYKDKGVINRLTEILDKMEKLNC